MLRIVPTGPVCLPLLPEQILLDAIVSMRSSHNPRVQEWQCSWQDICHETTPFQSPVLILTLCKHADSSRANYEGWSPYYQHGSGRNRHRQGAHKNCIQQNLYPM
jgi:hypothetical protein